MTRLKQRPNADGSPLSAACEKQKADLVLLVDQSGSIPPSDYETMKRFTTQLVNGFNIGKDFVRVGLAQFSDTFQDEFHLNRFYSGQEIHSHITAMRQRGGGTMIGAALRSIRAYFEASQGGRRSAGVSQNLLVITDGESQDDVEDAADALRALGIEMFAIGIGNIHKLELLQITLDPRNLFTVTDFNSLEKIRQKVIDTICIPKPIPQESSE